MPDTHIQLHIAAAEKLRGSIEGLNAKPKCVANWPTESSFLRGGGVGMISHSLPFLAHKSHFG